MTDTDERPRTLASPEPGDVVLLDRVIEIPPFTPEEVAYIEGLERAASQFATKVRIGCSRTGSRKVA